MLRRLSLRDVAIVRELELELGAGFSVLTGETGAGKSILIDALQFALGSRADATLVREGAARAEVSAEFDVTAPLLPWLETCGFDASAGTLLLRRSIDAQGRSRAWVNGSAATMTQLREAADILVDIHGQHAWQSLTRPAAVRTLLDERAQVDTAALLALWQSWRQALNALDQARQQRDTLAQESERLAWQIGEVERLAPGTNEWDELNAEHQRLDNAQALIDGARAALDALSDGELAADALCARALDALEVVQRYDQALAEVSTEVREALLRLQDAAHSLHSYLGRSEPDPQRLAQLDERLASWVSLARRYKRTPSELPALLAGWQDALRALQASADLAALEYAVGVAEGAWRTAAIKATKARKRAAPLLADAVTLAMQQLGMAGGQFEVALPTLEVPEAWGLESVELRVAGHSGSTPRPLAKVASGGELSRLALAIAVTTARERDAATAVPTLIFDEVDAGVGGAVADSVGRLMKQLGRSAQVLAVTHLAQVAACADQHFVVSKSQRAAQTLSDILAVSGEARVSEVARMLGGERLAGTSRAHAAALLNEQESK